MPLLSGNGARERKRTCKRVASCHSGKCLQKYFETLVAEKSKLAGNEETKGRYDEYEIEMLELVLNLPVKYKTVVYLYYYEGCNSVQIAKLLKKPESTIRTYLQKAKKLLKQELNEGNAVEVNQGSVYQTREE